MLAARPLQSSITFFIHPVYIRFRSILWLFSIFALKKLRLKYRKNGGDIFGGIFRDVSLTYTYLDCLLGVKMRGHKMAEIWEWLLMGSTADQYHDRPAGLLLWFVLVCRVMPRSLMFQDKLQLYKAKSSTFNSCFFILLYVYWKMEFNLFRFSTTIYLLASYCKWFYWTKVD